ncbi:MAG: YqgE/AlgH family protein [Planctomycetota bacterium]
MNSMAGHLLIAAPDMVDAYFSNTVVLVFQHSDEGAAGLVLNKPSDVQVNSVWDELDAKNAHAEKLINIGGPCEGPLIAIHNSLAFAEFPLIPGVAMTVGIDNLRKLIRQTHQTVRLFSGYAGWSPEQLDAEIDQGGWFSIPARPNYIFGDAGDLWRKACAKFGDEIVNSIVDQTLIPEDPHLN